MDIRIAKLVQF